ncbi:hypothetical protein PFMC_00377, partial [Plasmodium falciparum CAMP/Malaysia]
GIKTFDENNSTKIELLDKNTAGTNIVEKLGGLCNDPFKPTIQEWKCRFESSQNYYCVLQDDNKNTTPQEIVSFNSLFWPWITEMLKDSIDWSKELDKCINNENATKCIKWCKTPCKCYKKWVERMKKEWGDIKKHFDKQKNLIDNHHFTTLEMYLELEFLPSIEDAYGNDEAIDKIEELLEERRTHKDSELKDEEKKDIIDYLLKHEEDDAEKCTSTHTGEVTCTAEVNLHNNPCSEHVNKPTASVKDIARKMKSNARRQLGISGRKALKADASEGHYSRGGKADDIKNGAICKITLQHSNDTRRDSTGPCHGKDKDNDGVRFKIGTPWSNIVEKKTTSYEDVFLPPRRQHMCTSNLENLDVGSVTENGKASHSLLGDVQLAAKYEAEKIKELYEKNKDQSGQNDKNGLTDDKTVCRAMKNSFADIGDIIKGTDLWVNNQGENETERKLKEIFGSIHKSLKENKTKYTNDGKHLNLRSDWWTANRYQIWNAMKCSLKNGSFPCKSDHTPLHDYIPQRLRWMSEWAEWFCKYQSQKYDELMEACGSCKFKGQGCTSSDPKCTKCKNACDKYKTNINKWEEQWNTMEIKYTPLYHQAKTASARTSFDGTDPDYQQVFNFLSKLHRASVASSGKGVEPTTSPYESAAGYIHQEIGNVGCNIQNEFCFKKNGGTTPTAEDNTKYTFKQPPPEYEEACECMTREAPPEPKDEVNPCQIVDKLFQNPQQFKDVACTQKYGGKNRNLGWKCVDTTTKSGDTGGLCIPPRRRKLYVGKLETLDTHSTSQNDVKTPSQPGKTASQDPSEKLRTAFIESAAVETFFLWHRYKKENAPQSGSSLIALSPELTGSGSDDSDPDNLTPQQQLQNGEIPPDFLRLMFYTLGDYRDILVGNTDIVVHTSGNKEDMQKMEAIQKKIEQILPTSGSSPSPPRVTQTQHSVENPRKTWWNENGKKIWEGMVCALTYNTDTPSGTAPTQIQEVRTKLWDENSKNPKIPQYKYDQVKLDDTSDAKTTGSPIPSGEKITPLTDFISRPPYFRYLEEWGETFCKERKKRLEKIKEECRGDRTGHEHCSGDGYDCTRTDADRNDKFVDLNCRDCHIQCRKYRKWIDIKFDEYHKQEKKYQGEYDKLTKDKSSGGDNNCCKDIEKHKSAAVFLKELKHCKNGQTSENKGNQEDQLNKLDFDKIPQTFSPSTYCKACPVYGVNCNGNKRGRGGTNGCTTNNEPENKENDKGAASTISILINDGSTNGATNGTTGTTDETLKECSDKYAFFKGLRKQEWTCQKKYGVNQCNLTNRVNDTYFDKDIVFNEFFQRWLRYFVHDYNILKHKIDPCIKKEKQDKTEHKCINGCNIKCECVRKWLEIKGNEWGNIKKHYNINSNDDKETIAYNVKSYFVDQGLFDTDYKKAQKVVEDEKERKKIWGCTGHDECSEKEKEENKNFITNLISELQDKITSCQNKHNPNGKTACDPFPSPTPEETDPLDDDTPDPLDDDQHTEQPKFCPPPPPPMTCVEKIAKELRVEAEGKINNELKGNGKDFNGKCNNVKKKNGAVIGEESCKFEQTYENSVNNINNKCKDNQNERFKIGQKWNFKYIGTIRKDLCIPPRREHMCLDDLSMLGRTTISDSSALLKKIQEAAKSERDDIIRKLLEQNSCDEHRICDAMKYSFADLGDIIRGRDLWNKNSKQKGLQKRLEYAFINIYNKLQNDKNKYEKDRPKYLQLRSDWWDANRKHIWNAMTCNAPDDAKFLKKNPNDTSGSSSSKGIMTTHSNCGYDKEPPDYDYIPQPFRWMQEWSESFCKLLNEEMEQFEKTCGECKKNSITCEDDRNGTNCENCKNQCEKYKKLIHNWKLGFDKYKEIYNEIYNNKDSKINSNEYFKKFLEKLKDKCKELNSSDKYIDEATHCTKYKFSNSENKNHNNYAFKNPPKEYEKACKCDAPDPLDNCPKDSATYEKACNTLLPTKLCESKTFNNDDDSWDTSFVQTSPRDNTGVLVPPRRRQICLKNITTKLRSIEKIDDFKAELMTSAYNEGKLLCELYKKDRDVTLQAMKYSFYDYGDIVKGTDLISTAPLDKLKTKLNVLLKGDGTNEIKEDRGKWWTENRTRVWHAMLCGYKAAGGKIEERDCSLPDDNTHQFLRWFREWSEHFCAKRQKLFNEVKRECASAQCIIEYGTIDPPVCEEACTQYRDYITRKIQEYRLLNYQYNTNFNEKKAEVTKAPEYFNDKCNDKCNCLSKYIDIEKKWKNMYDSFDDNDLKNKCICRQIKPKRPPKKVKPEEEHTPSEQDTPPPLPPKPDDLPPPAEEPFNRDILEKTIPFGIALALGSIAFLFLKWNTLKDEFISQYLQSEQPKDVPNDYTSGDIPLNTQPNTLYFDNNQEKPFIMSIHDRNLYSGEEYNYDMSNNSGIYPSSSNRDSLSGTKVPYSGIDLINDSLSGNQHIDIYDEVLKRKENELFGTNHVKQTSIHSVAKLTNSDPIHNQIDLFHTWLDRHRDMCEKWENHHERLAKLKEQWENETHSGNTHPSDSNKTLNTDVSIQIHMDNPKPINEFTNMDTILEDLDKPFNEPYYYDMYDDDIYYDVNDHDTSTVDSNNMDVPSKVQIEMDINTKLVKEKYPIADVWDI